MLSRIPDRNIWLIYAAILLLGIAYGVSLAVLAIHLDAHGIAKVEMGALGGVFALGIAAFAVPAGASIRRFGAKATLLGALAGYAACVATFPFLRTLGLLFVARFFDGAFSAGVWVASETTLLARARREDKAFVMSLYAVSLALGYVIGPLAATRIVPMFGTGATFLVAGALAAAALLAILPLDPKAPIQQDDAPSSPDAPSAPAATTPAGRVFWRVKTSCFATFSYGYFQASVVLFLPLYLIQQKQVPAERTILVTAFFALGMLLFCTYFGRVGDRIGHLKVMRVLAAVGGVMVGSFVVIPSFSLMCVAVFVAGATLASISPVSLGLQGVVTPPEDLSRANAFYNASYAAGMILGPPTSSVFFERLGGGAMLLHLAALWATFVAFTIVFADDDPRAARA